MNESLHSIPCRVFLTRSNPESWLSSENPISTVPFHSGLFVIVTVIELKSPMEDSENVWLVFSLGRRKGHGRMTENNNNVLFYVLFHQTGAHSPLQSKELKHCQNKLAL